MIISRAMSMKPVYQMSAPELEAAAATAQPDAILRLAAMVGHGWRGFAPNEARALELVQHAAGMGSPRAMRLLGDRFNRGDGVDQSTPLAFTWWRNAARAGDVDAMANLIGLMSSADPATAAEGRHWAQLAASHGQPYAINVLAGGDPTPSLAAFASLSLEEMAAGAPPRTGTELAWSVEEVTGTLAQINDLVGWWLERLRAFWTDLAHQTTLDGDDLDFPCPDPRALPDGISSDNSSLEVTIRAGVIHLQLDATLWDEGWNLSLTSFEPHPPADGQAWLLGELHAVASQLGLGLG